MVCTLTSDFTQDVPEPSNARAGAAPNELRNTARGTPLPPPPPLPPVSLDQLLSTQNEFKRVLTENLVQCELCPTPLPARGGDFLHRLPADAPFDVC
jgi:hypothetical protein